MGWGIASCAEAGKACFTHAGGGEKALRGSDALPSNPEFPQDRMGSCRSRFIAAFGGFAFESLRHSAKFGQTKKPIVSHRLHGTYSILTHNLVRNAGYSLSLARLCPRPCTISLLERNHLLRSASPSQLFSPRLQPPLTSVFESLLRSPPLAKIFCSLNCLLLLVLRT